MAEAMQFNTKYSVMTVLARKDQMTKLNKASAGLTKEITRCEVKTYHT